MLAALLGSDPSQHWEHTTVYTQHAISTSKPPLETTYPQAASASPFTPAHKEHEGLQAFPASSNAFMCHWLHFHGRHHLRSTYNMELVFCCRGGAERRAAAKDSNAKQ